MLAMFFISRCICRVVQNSQHAMAQISLQIEPLMPYMVLTLVLMGTRKSGPQQIGPHMNSFISLASVHVKQGKQKHE